jgi:hypothetical protein
MTDHVLTLETTVGFDRLWIHCTCGWKSIAIDVPAPDRFNSVQLSLTITGHGHLKLVEPPDTINGRAIS